MRIHGTLKRWNDDRGYGFVALPQTEEEIFVHISAFPRGGTRPCIGEILSFEVRAGRDGRKRAEGVVRPGAPAPRRERRNTSAHRWRNAVGRALTIGAAILCAGYLVTALNRTGNTATSVAEFSRSGEAPTFTGQQATATTQSFKCDARTHCSQMSSCDEARYFSKHCPGAQMDGDSDGVPCEQWCD